MYWHLTQPCFIFSILKRSSSILHAIKFQGLISTWSDHFAYPSFLWTRTFTSFKPRGSHSGHRNLAINISNSKATGRGAGSLRRPIAPLWRRKSCHSVSLSECHHSNHHDYIWCKKRLTDQLGYHAELIDKCVGSRIWVVMKGEKGTFYPLWSRCGKRGRYELLMADFLSSNRIRWDITGFRWLCQ